MAKTTNVKLQNKTTNKTKRQSFRVEKDARRAKRAEENASKITAYIGGEAVQISSKSKQGKKILEKQKRRKAEAKNDRKFEQRHARVSQDDVRAVLQGKRTGTTITQLKEKLAAEKAALKAGGSVMKDSDSDSDDDDDDSVKNKSQSKPLSAAQREIQEMMERTKRAAELEAKILALQNGDDVDGSDDDDEQDNVKSTKPKRITAKQMKKLKAEERRMKSKDYEDEEDLDLGLGDSDDDGSEMMIDSDEYEMEDDGSDIDYDDDDGVDVNNSDGDSDDSDYEVRQQYKEQHRTFIKTTKNMGEKKDVRAAMIATLYDDLPKYKPMPAKMAGLLKSQGKNVKEVEAQRKSDHDLKVKKILAEREKRIREYDSDDEDSDREEGEDEADYFLRKMSEQQERRKQRKAEQVQEDDDDDESDDGDDEDNDDDDASSSEDEKQLSLIQVKQASKDQRQLQKQQLKELWLQQREERIQAAKERSGGVELEKKSKLQQTTKIDPKNAKNTSTTNITNTTSTVTKTLDSLDNKDEAIRKKQEMKTIQELKQKEEQRTSERLMVLLDDGTWGYRDVVHDDDNDDQMGDDNTTKPDLSAYVRAPKKSKKELKAEERAAAEALEPDPLDDGKTSDALAKFEAFMSKTDNKKSTTKPAPTAPVTKSTKTTTVKRDDDDDDYGFDDDDDFDEDMEFEIDNDMNTDTYLDPSHKRSAMHDIDSDDEEDEMKRLLIVERKKVKQQFHQLEQFHESRLDRIRQVQLILGQLCTELLENPHKYIVGGHLEALLKLCADKDSTVQQLAIASTATVFTDIVPAYRIKYHNSTTHAGTNNTTRLTKDVRIMRTYENQLLDQYKAFLSILNKYVHRGLSLFYAKQRQLWNAANAKAVAEQKAKFASANNITNATTGTDAPLTNPYEEYSNVNIDLAEKQTTLYTIALKSSCQVFSSAYAFNFNTQLGGLLAHVLTSDYVEWSDLVGKCVVEVFKKDKCSESTHEIVQTIADVCKKRAGEKIRAPLLAVLLEIPFSYQVIHYKDPNEAKKALKAKQEAKKAKESGKLKGVTGAGHHYAQRMQQQQERTLKQMKKALRSGKEYQGPDPNENKGKSLHDLQLEVQREMKESEAVLSITERQKLQTKSLSLVFTIFFRYLKQAPTIKTLYNYNTVNAEHQQQYDLMKQSFTAQSTVHKTVELLSIPKEHRNQVVLTQTMLGIVTPPTHFVLAIILKGIMKFGSLINVELVLDLLSHLLLVIQTATALESLPLSSSLLSLECIFTLLQLHGNAIDIDLAPHYQVLYNIIWQLLYHPEYTFLLIKCIDLSIIHRKHLQFRRVAAIVRRIFQVTLHLPPQYALPLLQIASQCCTAHPTIGTIFDNDKLQQGLYDLGHPHPDTSDAIGSSAWEAVSTAQSYHPYSTPITLHTLLSDLRLGTTTNVDGKNVSNNVDRSTLSISLTTLELPNETNQLERPQRITRQIAVSRLKPLELYTAIDISKGGFCPDVEGPDVKKLRKLMHYEWYDRYNWLSQVEQMKDNGMFNHFNLSYQSKLMTDILGGEDTVSSFLEQPIKQQRYYQDE